ncbi:MAG: hypothetical protein NUV51_12585 [Sulfuricaulis sp.]|nr:hypothetical protein [Sulfuricaulis sp.]
MTTEAPKFEPQSLSYWERYSTFLYQPDPEVSLFVRAERNGTLNVNAVGHMCSSRVDLTPAVARALAAELVAAADAAEAVEAKVAA